MDVRSAHLYGQFSLDKTLTLQAGTTVLHNTLQKQVFFFPNNKQTLYFFSSQTCGAQPWTHPEICMLFGPAISEELAIPQHDLAMPVTPRTSLAAFGGLRIKRRRGPFPWSRVRYWREGICERKVAFVSLSWPFFVLFVYSFYWVTEETRYSQFILSILCHNPGKEVKSIPKPRWRRTGKTFARFKYPASTAAYIFTSNEQELIELYYVT